MTLIRPRSNDCILGGTTQENDWSTDVRDEDTKGIISRCSKVIPVIQSCKILDVQVGLRPGRNEVRLEQENITSDC